VSLSQYVHIVIYEPCLIVSHSFAEQTSERRAVSDGSVSAGLAVRPGTAGSGADGKRNRRGRSQRPERRSRRREKRVQLRTRHSDEQKRPAPVRPSFVALLGLYV